MNNYKIYKKENVFEESLNRIRFLFDEFEDVWVCISGGKDSTVIYNLALIVAKEKNRLPLRVLFIDQEAEWQGTIDYIKTIMYDENVKPYWLQVPIKLFNATSVNEDWLYCWEQGKEWIREKDKISYKENVWGTDRFVKLFRKFIEKESKNKKACMISGVRVEESQGRYLGCTQEKTYKYITYGAKYNNIQYNFYPIYDWKYLDIWKSIHDNKWDYNIVYDYQYRYGIQIMDMRVSNLHHETAVKNLFYLQEVEPDTYNKLAKRLKGIDSACKLDDNYFVKELPYMFKDWEEYCFFLLEKLIVDKDKKNRLKKQIISFSNKLKDVLSEKRIYRFCIQSILCNDYHGTKLHNARTKHAIKLKDLKRKNKND